jgi:aspartate/methionine/tyrosine aminotransferase
VALDAEARRWDEVPDPLQLPAEPRWRLQGPVGPAGSKKSGGYADITQHEIDALTRRHNLADAHTHQRQSPTQRRIVESLPRLWYEAEEQLQRDLEQRFTTAFFTLHRQPTALTTGRPLLSYAASISTVVVATYLMQRRMSVSLIEPCFDNLHDLLRNQGVPLRPLREELLADVDRIYDNLCKEVTTDALFLVDPNNPTGFTLLTEGRPAFEEVIRFCVDRGKLLIIDRCFASFALMDAGSKTFDIYELLESSGVSYLVVEDTGKTWPLQDAKCAILMSSQDIYQTIYDIHTSVLLNVSPFTLNMLTQYLLDSIRDGFASVRNVINMNRAELQNALSEAPIRICKPRVGVSVAWLDISALGLDATTFQRRLLAREVYVLPGTFFFWSDHRQGDSFVRVALAREPDRFKLAVRQLALEVQRHVQ